MYNLTNSLKSFPSFRTITGIKRRLWPNFFISENPWEELFEENEPVEKIYEYGESGVKYNQINKNDTVVLEIAVPGVSKDQIDIDTKESEGLKYLRIKQKEKENEKDEDNNEKIFYVVKKLFTSYFEIIFRVDHLINTSEMKVSLKDGILSVILPKGDQKEDKIKKISIQWFKAPISNRG